MATTIKKTVQKDTAASGEVAEDALTMQRTEADSIIRRYALLGTASGLIPVLGIDVLAVTALQTKMIKDLADLYDYDIDDQLIRTALTTGITAIGSRLLTAIAGALAENITPLKMFITGATQAAVNGFLTLEIGYLYKSRMELGENPSDIGVMGIVHHLVAQVQEGKWDPNNLSLTSQLTSLVGNKN